jgi:hypothetical protein
MLIASQPKPNAMMRGRSAAVEEAIPIAILHRNEFDSLFKMIESIILNTRHPYQIFVVDNNSSVSNRQEEFERLRAIPGLTLIESKRNDWALGFNRALQHPGWPRTADYYVLSDADIVLPAVASDRGCWLTYLKTQMNAHACIGKLGVSLRWDDIDNQVVKESVIRQEERFLANPKIGDNTIAPVDTTLAIYRRDFFVLDEFAFFIGHASLARPYYYTCRTSDKLVAKHLGWYTNSALKLDGFALKEKIRCFAHYGGYIDPAVLKLCDASSRWYYKIVHPLSVLYWGLRVVVYNFAYLTKRFPRRVNEIQSRCR